MSFFILPVAEAIKASFLIATIILFAIGAFKTKITIVNPIKSGVEMTAIGIATILIGYIIGGV